MRRRTLTSIVGIGTAFALAIGLAVAVPGVASADAPPIVYGWGSNASSQISDAAGAIGSGTVDSLSVSSDHAVALLDDGSVVDWGGPNDPTVTLASAMGDNTAVQVAAGADYGLALLTNGTIVGWGEDTDGILSGISAANGAGTITQISASGIDALALTSDGKVVGWGSNSNGQTATQNFGAGTVKQIVAAGSSSFAVKNDGTVGAWGFAPSTQNAAIGSGGIAAIAASNTHTIALKTNGSVVAWGFSLSTNIAGCASGLIPDGETATAVAAGSDFNELLLSDGSVVTCGDNTTISGATNPVGAAEVTQIAAGSDTAFAVADPTSLIINNAEDISAGTLAPGGQLNVRGGTFRASLPIVESIDGTQFATGTTAVDGSLDEDHTLPTTLTTGAHTLTVSVGGQVFTYTLHIAPGFVTATPTLTGTTKVGSTLEANTGLWSSDTSFAYQWFRSGKAIPLISIHEYTLQPADAGKKITVKVTGTPHGFPASVKAVAKTSASTAAVTPGDLLAVEGPAFQGTNSTVGTTATVSPGTWAPGNPTFAYQWFANGVAVKGATSANFLMPGSVAGKKLTVEVTAKETGYATKTMTVGPSVFIGLGTLDAGNVQLSGSAVVGTKLKLTAPAFDTSVTSSYQWLRDGEIIPRATASSYTVTTADREHRLSLTVTGYKLGYQGADSVSGLTPTVLTSAVPTISGTTTVGSTLTASPGTWTLGIGLKFEWLRISGKTSTVIQTTVISDTDTSTTDLYTLVAADKGKTIEVRVTGTQGGYDNAFQTSKATKKIG